MNFKQLIEHYESLDKKELIKKLVDKNTLILKQEDEIERQNNEITNLKQLEESLLLVVYDEWLELAYLEGLLDLPAYLAQPDMYRSVRWCYPPFHWVDPEKETKSALMAVQAGFRTQSDVIQELGGDFNDLINQRAQEMEAAKQAGLTFISNTDASTQKDLSTVEEKPNKDDEENAEEKASS